MFQIFPLFLKATKQSLSPEGDMRLRVLRTYPITVYKRLPGGKIRWIGFVFALFYRTNQGEEILRLESPLCFINRREDKRKVYERLIQETNELAESQGVGRIEAELYKESRGKICFPSNLSISSGYNHPGAVRPFLDCGFKEKYELVCYEIKTDPTSINVDTHGFSVRRIEEQDDEQLYRDLTSQPEDPTSLGSSLHHGIELFSDRRYVRLIEKNGKILGFTHWFPDFYPLIKRYCGIPITSQHLETAWGKIFRVLLLTPNKETYRVLLSETIKVMQEYGISQFQVGNINPENHELVRAIESIGGKKIHVLSHMERHTS
jgi:hypothetical protein